MGGIYYVPNFLSTEEGRLLQEAARRGVGEEGGVGVGGAKWRDLYQRRLRIYGGTPHPSGMVEEELPAFLREGAVGEGTAVPSCVSGYTLQALTWKIMFWYKIKYSRIGAGELKQVPVQWITGYRNVGIAK